MWWLIGWEDLLIVWAPPALLAGSVGIWLFYVQHQFESVNWQHHDEWSYAVAALGGSSYLKLPTLLQFFTANIGLHHVHHLNSRIPNYNLQRAHDPNVIFAGVPTVSIRDGLRAVTSSSGMKTTGQLVTLTQANRNPQRAARVTSFKRPTAHGVLRLVWEWGASPARRQARRVTRALGRWHHAGRTEGPASPIPHSAVTSKWDMTPKCRSTSHGRERIVRRQAAAHRSRQTPRLHRRLRERGPGRSGAAFGVAEPLYGEDSLPEIDRSDSPDDGFRMS